MCVYHRISLKNKATTLWARDWAEEGKKHFERVGVAKGSS